MLSITFYFVQSVWEYSSGRGKKESYGGEASPLDALSPSQQFAINSGIEKAKIFRGTQFTVEEFNLEDYKHLKEDMNASNGATNADDDDDEDNVA